MKLKFAILSIFLVISSSNITAQSLKKTLINDNLDELFINKDNPFGDIPSKTVEKYFSEVSNIYFFEMVFGDKVIFSESIPKSIPLSRDSETMANQFRFKYNTIYLDATLFCDGDKLQLLESRKNRLTEIGGKKLIAINDFAIIKKDIKSNKYIIVSPIEGIKINVYKISQ